MLPFSFAILSKAQYHIPVFSADEATNRRRTSLIVLILATLPCYCLGRIALQYAPGARTSTPTPSWTGTSTLTPSTTASPSATPIVLTATWTFTPTATFTLTHTLTPLPPPSLTPFLPPTVT